MRPKWQKVVITWLILDLEGSTLVEGHKKTHIFYNKFHYEKIREQYLI
jgi:hypothetical protein